MPRSRTRSATVARGARRVAPLAGHDGGQHRHPRRPRAQSQEHRRRDPARAARRRSPGSRARASRRSPSTRSTPRASGATSSRCRPTRASSSSRWRSPTATPSRGCRRRSRSSRRASGRNPRSTVGTVTEIADYLRLLFARVGHPVCFQCGREIAAQTVQQVVDRLVALPARHAALPLRAGGARSQGRAQEGARRAAPRRLRARARRRRAARPGRRHRRSRGPRATPSRCWSTGSSCAAGRRAPARRLARGRLPSRRRHACSSRRARPARREPQALFFSERHACPVCGVSYPELAPRFFSFNSPHGACPDLRRSRRAAPLRPDAGRPRAAEGAARRRSRSVVLRALPGLEESLARARRPLPLPARHALRRRCPRRRGTRSCSTARATRRSSVPRERRRHGAAGRSPASSRCSSDASGRRAPTWLREEIEGLVAEARCPTCDGTRLRREARFVLVGGRSIARSRRSRSATRSRFFDGLELGAAGGGDRPADPEGDARAARLPGRRRPRLPDARPRRRHALRRRGTAHPPRDADRLAADRRALHPRRAVDRAAPARQRAPARDAARAARPRQHGASSSSTTATRSSPPTT